jgi:hypothetical protein
MHMKTIMAARRKLKAEIEAKVASGDFKVEGKPKKKSEGAKSTVDKIKDAVTPKKKSSAKKAK